MLLLLCVVVGGGSLPLLLLFLLFALVVLLLLCLFESMGLVSGMGDALSLHFTLRACLHAPSPLPSPLLPFAGR